MCCVVPNWHFLCYVLFLSVIRVHFQQAICQGHAFPILQHLNHCSPQCFLGNKRSVWCDAFAPQLHKVAQSSCVLSTSVDNGMTVISLVNFTISLAKKKEKLTTYAHTFLTIFFQNNSITNKIVLIWVRSYDLNSSSNIKSIFV